MLGQLVFPAVNNSSSSGLLNNCLYTKRVEVAGFVGQLYWSSTDAFLVDARDQLFSDGSQDFDLKNFSIECFMCGLLSLKNSLSR